ncbi:MAG: RibD family protein [Planctomycetota bacterium]
MVCELDDNAAWPALLAMRALLAAERNSAQPSGTQPSGTQPPLLLVQHDGAWTCMPAHAADFRHAKQVLAVSASRASGDQRAMPPGRSAFSIYTPSATGLPNFTHPTGHPIDAATLSLASVYLPILLGAAAARAASRTFVVGHVTQSLDGRIACANGQSQWIGNDADLSHTHRMRALVDGVLVGAGTALTDDPRLTVRHVNGPDPRRIVLSGSGRVLRSERPLQLFSPPGCDVVLAAGVDTPSRGDATKLVKVRGSGSALAPRAVLDALHARGMHSLYLEGGSITLSSFLQANCIDLLQIHIAAMVLGSGVSSFSLPTVDHVKHGVQFVMQHTMLDGHVLLSCWPKPAAD